MPLPLLPSWPSRVHRCRSPHLAHSTRKHDTNTKLLLCASEEPTMCHFTCVSHTTALHLHNGAESPFHTAGNRLGKVSPLVRGHEGCERPTWDLPLSQFPGQRSELLDAPSCSDGNRGGQGECACSAKLGSGGRAWDEGRHPLRPEVRGARSGWGL